MKLRTRVVAATLTAAMALQMPLTAFAQEVAAVNTENSGNIVIVDENGNQKTITPEEFNELNNADAAEESSTAEVPALTPEPKVEPEKGIDETVDAEESENTQQAPEADATESQPEEAPPAEGAAEEQQEVAVQENVIYWNPGEMYDGMATHRQPAAICKWLPMKRLPTRTAVAPTNCCATTPTKASAC